MSLQPPRMRLIQEGSVGTFQPEGILAQPELVAFQTQQVRSSSRKRKSSSRSGIVAAGSGHPGPETKVKRGPNCIYNRNFVNNPLPDQTNYQRRRTSDDFLHFCKMILDYENYSVDSEEARKRHSSSPLGSTGSSASSWDSAKQEDNTKRPSKDVDDDDDEDKDGWDEVTCYCKKPFAGRPMIECSACLTWIHLKCAKLNKNRIPEHWFCHKCQPLRQKPIKAKPSPAKNKVSGSRKRKLSLTSKRVVKRDVEDPSPTKTEALPVKTMEVDQPSTNSEQSEDVKKEVKPEGTEVKTEEEQS